MIQLKNLYKSFGDHVVTNNLCLHLPTERMTVIIGRSGEGKSVLLKQIIGLIKPCSGNILINDQDIYTLNHNQRQKLYQQFGYVFQFAALFDSLTIFENIGIQLIEKGIHQSEICFKVEEKLQLVQLPRHILYKYPSELSGGMRKRVGLARALINNPKVILYDEPTAGLDPITSKAIHELMHSIQQEHKLTSIVVSHDTEIFHYADNVALLQQGTIKYFGPTKSIWQSQNHYITQFTHAHIQRPSYIL